MTETLPATTSGHHYVPLKGMRGTFVEYYTGNAPVENERERLSYFLKATPSARAAGYKHPPQDGSRLLKDVHVRHAIDALLADNLSGKNVAISLMLQDATRSDDEILEVASRVDGQAVQAAVASSLFTARTTQRSNLVKANGLLKEQLDVNVKSVEIRLNGLDLERLGLGAGDVIDAEGDVQ